MTGPRFTYRILLYLAPCGTWYADMTAASPDVAGQTVARIMGTSQIPTPYTRLTPWEDVRDCIQARNPNDEILVDILSRRVSR